MKLKVDRESDALYFRLDETATIVESEEVQPGVILDFDTENRVVGIEILGLSTRVPSDRLRIAVRDGVKDDIVPSYDFMVVGSGIAGLYTALLSRERGKE